MDKKLAFLEVILSNQVKHAQESLAKFTQELLENPRYSMEWSDNAFLQAAEYDVARTYLAWIEKGCTLSEIEADLDDEVLNAARWGSNSTSPGTNVMKQHLLASKARLLTEVRRLAKQN